MQRETRSPAPGKLLTHATLFNIGEAISGLLCPRLGFPVQGTHGHTEVSPVKGHRDDLKTGTSVIGESWHFLSKKRREGLGKSLHCV